MTSARDAGSGGSSRAGLGPGAESRIPMAITVIGA